MQSNQKSIEAGLALFQQILMDTKGIGKEFESSRIEFNAILPTDEEEAALARRRHFEWYLLERDSKQLDAIPAVACMDAWLQAAAPEFVDHSEAFLHSFAGVFEVSSAEANQGLWLSDIFGLGEYPVESPGTELDVEVGDLLVGRLFPIGEGIHCLSLAVTLYREPQLIKAVRRDLNSLRKSRRGVMRIGQQELERLFFEIQVQTDGANSDGVDLNKERQRARRGLAKAGLDESSIDEVLLEVTKSSVEADSEAVTRILNALAFEEQVDLEQAQRVLAQLWAAESDPSATCAPEAASGDSTAATKSFGKDAHAALKRFDQERAKGHDTEGLYSQLAQELGLDGDDEEQGEITLPDFPGVVGAMVEEFLWDVERTQGPAVADSLGRIRLLAEFGADIGVFETLGRSQILDYAGRWLLDSGKLEGPEDARASIQALTEFCAWTQEQHDHPIMDECAEFLGPLAKSLPRLAELKKHCAEQSSTHKPYSVLAIGEQGISLADENGRKISAAIQLAESQLLRDGDLLHGAIKEDTFQLSACYPGELRKLLDYRNSD